MAKNGQKKMGDNGQKWEKMAENGPKNGRKMAENGRKWPKMGEMAENGPKMTENGWGGQNGQK